MDTRLAAALVVIGVAWGCGGEKNPAASHATPPPPTTLAPSTFADLSAAVTSPQHGLAINCKDAVRVRVAVTNRGGTSVRVTGVKRTTSVVSGRCNAAPDFTYGREVDFALPNATTVMVDQALYRDGTGCCPDQRSCRGGCDLKESFTVLTDLGQLAAGHIEYGLEFSDCRICGASEASRGRCPSARRLDEP